MRGVRLSARLGIGGLLLAAGFLKIGDGWAFAEAVANYRLLPAAGNQLAAVTLPWCELAVGALLMLGLWERAAVLAAAALFGGFLLATGAALLRGLDGSCGCWGSVQVPAPWIFALDLLVLAALLSLARKSVLSTSGA